MWLSEIRNKNPVTRRMIPRSSYPDTPGCSATSASSTSFVVMVALPAHIRHSVLPSLYRHRYIGTGLMVHDVDGSRDASRGGPAGSASVDGLHTSWTSRPLGPEKEEIGSAQMPYATVNPYTNELVKSFPDATDEEVDAVLDRAQEAYRSWSRVPVAERCAIFTKASQLVLERKEELARLATLEMGKLYGESLGEVQDNAASMLAYFAENAEGMLRPKSLENAYPDQEVMMLYQPQGIVFSIEPWNVPYYQAIRAFAPNAIAGNVVILKHASIVPQCAAAIVQVLPAA